jgi:hypothetical protein
VQNREGETTTCKTNKACTSFAEGLRRPIFEALAG